VLPVLVSEELVVVLVELVFDYVVDPDYVFVFVDVVVVVVVDVVVGLVEHVLNIN